MQTLSIITLAALLVSASLAEVDYEKPDLSCFKLRHVDRNELAKKRIELEISDLSKGAQQMRESLFVDANYVKCPAYAQLFKMIKKQALFPAERVKSDLIIRQKVVQSLAIVVTYERIFYHQLFQHKLPISVAHFIEAAKGLERSDRPVDQETWSDLISCLSEYMSGEPNVAEFLGAPTRAEARRSVSKYMSVPVDNEHAPRGLVANLARRYEDHKIIVDPNLYESSREAILSFEDEETAALRRAYEASLEDKGRRVKGGIVIDVSDNDSANTNGQLVDRQEIKNVEIPGAIELITNDHESSSSSSSPLFDNDYETTTNDACNDPLANLYGDKFELDRLAVLKFIKMRLESAQRSRPKLNIRLAFDFSSHWQDLARAKLSGNSQNETTKAAIEFRNSKENKRLYERIARVIEQYESIVGVLEDIDALGRGQMESVGELKVLMTRLNALLAQIDRSFNLDDIRRVQAIWKAKFVEYKTMQSFIDSTSW